MLIDGDGECTITVESLNAAHDMDCDAIVPRQSRAISYRRCTHGDFYLPILSSLKTTGQSAATKTLIRRS
jgi:hypothetical protein